MATSIPKFPKPKKLTYSKAKKQAWQAFSEFIRLRDCLKTTNTLTHGTCYTCDTDKPFKLLDAGHFVGQRHNQYLFDPMQVHAQCKRCNGFLQGNGAMYYRKMVEEYGEDTVLIIMEQNKQIRKYKVYELVELMEEYQQKVNDIRKGV